MPLILLWSLFLALSAVENLCKVELMYMLRLALNKKNNVQYLTQVYSVE